MSKKQESKKQAAQYNVALVKTLAEEKKFLVIPKTGEPKLSTRRKITGAPSIMKKLGNEATSLVYDLKYRVTGPKSAVDAFTKAHESALTKDAAGKRYTIEQVVGFIKSKDGEVPADIRAEIGERKKAKTREEKFNDINKDLINLDLLMNSTLVKRADKLLGAEDAKKFMESKKSKAAKGSRAKGLLDRAASALGDEKVINVTEVTKSDAGNWTNVRAVKKTANMRPVLTEAEGVYVLPKNLSEEKVGMIIEYLKAENIKFTESDVRERLSAHMDEFSQIEAERVEKKSQASKRSPSKKPAKKAAKKSQSSKRKAAKKASNE